MSKNETQIVATAPDVQQPAASAQTDFELTLDEFCARLSARDRRVELIAAFHHIESAAGRVKASEPAFVARFSALATQPV